MIVPSLIRKSWELFKRDLLMEISYKLSFMFQFVGIFFSIFMFYFISRLLESGGVTSIGHYGSNYFTFVLIGLAFFGYSDMALNSYSEKFRREQLMGTLEVLLSTPTSPFVFVLGSSLWDFFIVTIRAGLYLLTGLVVFKIKFCNVNIAALLLIFMLGLASFMSLGIISAAFVIVFKRGNPMTMLFGSLSGLLGGAFYPISVMPPWLQVISHFLPLTYFLRAMRLALLKAYGIGDLIFELGVLLGFAALLLPTSILLFELAIRRARVTGALSSY